MLIEEYFQQIKLLIESSSIVQLFNLERDKRGIYEGFIRGKIDFNDNSLLHFREFVYVEIYLNRKMYSYQYMDSVNNLIFRYDNTEHHRKLNLSTFPHHKHDGSEDNVITSDAPLLAEVLKEVEKIIHQQNP
ncbi:toxin-antitoxin system TumE family protein [Coleofasciculus sp. E1-EBD-02]|uniref:toxin-antitoxin system TumE family protein n=1 Tax=Coleofasciculus sp. E1-EBD-02 TaxID=3068481 RepID=UPI0032F5D9F2